MNKHRFFLALLLLIGCSNLMALTTKALIGSIKSRIRSVSKTHNIQSIKLLIAQLSELNSTVGDKYLKECVDDLDNIYKSIKNIKLFYELHEPNQLNELYIYESEQKILPGIIKPKTGKENQPYTRLHRKKIIQRIGKTEELRKKELNDVLVDLKTTLDEISQALPRKKRPRIDWVQRNLKQESQANSGIEVEQQQPAAAAQVPQRRDGDGDNGLASLGMPKAMLS